MKVLIYATVFLLIYSCNNTQKNKHLDDNSRIINKDSISSFFSTEISTFDLHLPDSIRLIYSYMKDYDSCFILILNKSNNLIKGRLFYYPPSYYKYFSQWEDLKIFRYKAINFNIPLEKWSELSQLIYNQSNLLKRRSDNYLTQSIHPLKAKIYIADSLISNKEFENIYFYKVHDIIGDYILSDIIFTD